MNSKVFNFLEYQIKEILEDILLFSPFTACILFYQEKVDGLHYVDYEVANTEEPKLDIFPDKLDFEIVEGFKKAKEEGRLVPDFTNEIYEGESYKIIPLKDLLKIILKIQNTNLSNDSIVIQSYQLINQISSYKLAQIVGISKQAMSQFLLDQRPFPERIKKKIATFLKFDSSEFLEEIDHFLFDETDL